MGRSRRRPRPRPADEEEEEEPKSKNGDFNQVMQDMLRREKSPSGLLPFIMLQLLERQQEPSSRSRSSQDALGDLDDPELHHDMKDMGLQTVRNLQSMRKRITRDPLTIVKSFESNMRDELGLVPGRSWTLRQWLADLPKTPFGKRAFVGDQDELAVITAFEKQMIGIRKRQRKIKAALGGSPGSSDQKE